MLTNNFLGNPALSLVKGLTDIDEIWDRLKKAYGNTKLLLSRKLGDIKKLEPLSKLKEDPTKVLNVVTRLINILRDLIQLAEKHDIENQLYYGDGLEQIYRL